MSSLLLKNGIVVTDGVSRPLDVLVKDSRIEKLDVNIDDPNAQIIDLNGKLVLPGCIDDQVHFREPGLTHKANIFSESRAAVAGGITSFMEMPNTKPNAVTQELLEDKYKIAQTSSLANYSFFMGATNDNLEEVLQTNENNICGIKVFMGSSTGNMLVDNEKTLEGLFSRVPMLIATHCEDEETIRKNLEQATNKYGDSIPMWMLQVIRNEEDCFLSS